IQHFKQGTYNSETGTADFTVKKYPFIIEKLTRLHKATVKEPLFFLNIFFGLSLLFFCTVVFLYVYARHRHFQKRYVFYFGRNCAYIDYAVCIKPVGLTTFRKLSNLKSLYLAKFRNAPNIK